MRRATLKIEGGKDFVIITPQMLSALICQIRIHTVQCFTVPVEEIMPGRLEQYLEKLINTNRYAAPCFRYSDIMEEPITKDGLYRIVGSQLEVLKMDRTACFHSVVPVDATDGEAALDIACTEPFFLACKDITMRFAYIGQSGERKIINRYFARKD